MRKNHRQFLLLLFARKIKVKVKLWGVIYDIDHTPHTIVYGLHGNAVDQHDVINRATRKVAQSNAQADLCAYDV